MKHKIITAAIALLAALLAVSNPSLASTKCTVTATNQWSVNEEMQLIVETESGKLYSFEGVENEPEQVSVFELDSPMVSHKTDPEVSSLIVTSQCQAVPEIVETTTIEPEPEITTTTVKVDSVETTSTSSTIVEPEIEVDIPVVKEPGYTG